MSVTKLAIGAGVIVLGLLVWLATIGFTAATALLVTAVGLVVLIGGGNWLSRGSPHRPPPGYRSATPPSSTYQPGPEDVDGEPGPREAPGP